MMSIHRTLCACALLVGLLLGCGPATRHITPPPLVPPPPQSAPAQAKALYLRGEILLSQQEWAAAQDAFSRALRLDPEQPTLLLALAEAAEGLGDTAGAADYRQRALAAKARANEAQRVEREIR